MKFVSIIMGSKSDFDVMKSCSETLEAFGVQYELRDQRGTGIYRSRRYGSAFGRCSSF